MPHTQATLLARLAELGIETTTKAHPPLFTVAESQELRGSIAGAHTKNLFLKDKKDNFFLVTTGEEAALDLKAIHRDLGASGRVSFGKPERLMELLGVAPGSVTPFAAINDTEKRVSVVLEAELMESEIINAHPLTNEATTSIGSRDLVRFLEAVDHPPRVLKLSR